MRQAQSVQEHSDVRQHGDQGRHRRRHQPVAEHVEHAGRADGVALSHPDRGVLDEIGYDGLFEIELFSRFDWWLRDGEETVAVSVERCAPLVGERTKVPC